MIRLTLKTLFVFRKNNDFHVPKKTFNSSLLLNNSAMRSANSWPLTSIQKNIMSNMEHRRKQSSVEVPRIPMLLGTEHVDTFSVLQNILHSAKTLAYFENKIELVKNLSIFRTDFYYLFQTPFTRFSRRKLGRKHKQNVLLMLLILNKI